MTLKVKGKEALTATMGTADKLKPGTVFQDDDDGDIGIRLENGDGVVWLCRGQGRRHFFASPEVDLDSTVVRRTFPNATLELEPE